MVGGGIFDLLLPSTTTPRSVQLQTATSGVVNTATTSLSVTSSTASFLGVPDALTQLVSVMSVYQDCKHYGDCRQEPRDIYPPNLRAKN